MITYPPQTSIIEPFQIKDIQDGLSRLWMVQKPGTVIRETDYVDNSDSPKIYELTPLDKSIGLFSLPIPFSTSTKGDGDGNIIVDIRPFSRVDRNDAVVINNIVEYKFNMDVAALTRYWAQNKSMPVPLKLLLRAWVNWLGTALISKLNIEPTLQPTVNIITAYYMYCMINKIEKPIDSSNIRHAASAIGHATFSTTMLVVEHLEKIPQPVTNIATFIDTLKTFSGSARFDKLTPGFLFSLVQFGWYGSAVVKVTGAAIEYPPIFIAMLYNAIAQDGYNKTTIGRIVKDSTIPADVKEFEQRVKRLIHSQ